MTCKALEVFAGRSSARRTVKRALSQTNDPRTILFAYKERDAPPYRDPATGEPLPANHYDSVIENHRCLTSFPKDRQSHQDFVVYEKNQAYPEYLIEVTVSEEIKASKEE